MNPELIDSWGMGNDKVRCKFKLPCLCEPGKGEWVNVKFLYPDEAHEKNVTVYECLKCRSVVSLIANYRDGEIIIISKTERGKNKDKPINPRVDEASRDWYRTHITRTAVEKILGKMGDKPEDPDDPKNWKTGWKFNGK